MWLRSFYKILCFYFYTKIYFFKCYPSSLYKLKLNLLGISNHICYSICVICTKTRIWDQALYHWLWWKKNVLTVIRFFLQEKSCKRITRLYIFRMVLLWEVISCLQYPDESYFIKGSSKTNECILKTAISKKLSKCIPILFENICCISVMMHHLNRYGFLSFNVYLQFYKY